MQGNWRQKAFTYTDNNGQVIAETVRKGMFSGIVNFLTGACLAIPKHIPKAKPSILISRI